MKPLLLFDLQNFEHKLAIELSRVSTQACPQLPPERRHEGWLICPRAHATKYNFRVPPFSIELMDKLTTEGWPLYDELHRAHHGDDLVLAIGDIQ